MIGIVFQHDAVAMKAVGAPIAVVSPCEGTGCKISSMSVIAGARHMDEAERFYDFALRADVQTKAREAKSYQVPSNKNAEPPQSPKLSEIRNVAGCCPSGMPRSVRCPADRHELDVAP